ncbi:scopoletin glucosyltransferase-like [Cornus florida]|uniref:scopoletin glucosyltransferase-like n=1 Tax=Cornus florida TaxID=4283 RepID=UPI00289CFDCA|nr:scopoletin glucosyltransferase-like [Cornus florida]
MASKPHQLHIYFFPMMAHGHMIPMVDMAKLFSGHGVKATIITTPLNAPLISKTIDMDTELGSNISIRVIKFSSLEVGLPEGCENLSSVTSPEMIVKFYKATYMLQEPFEQLLREDSPDCLVADMYFPWATELASKLGIPKLVFHGTGVFPLCVHHSLVHHKPFKNIESDSEPVIVPGLPDTIKMTRRELSDHNREGETQNYIATLFQEIMKAELTSYGVLVNSFHELEPAYSEYYREVVGRKAWHIGPVSLFNRDNELKGKRGNKSSIDEEECLNWLDSKKPKSVLYVCFGSLADFSAAQLLEIAKGLEASEQQFIWVVRKEKEEKEEWLPEGFEKRIEGKGLIIRGWAPQVLILENEAVGGFVTHCGWNSLLEGVTAGVPMVTWPLFVDQFANEKFVTDVLRIGVRVGAQGWSRWAEDNKGSVRKEDIEMAVTQLMVSAEAEIMRNRARALKEKARRAVEDGGSSYSDLNALLEELRSIRS